LSDLRLAGEVNDAFIIREFLAARRLAIAADDWPLHCECANIASKLRERADLSPVRVSRQDVAGSRQHGLFQQLLSLQMKEMFSRWLDNEVTDLMNVLFPRAFATSDSVHAARRAKTRRSR